MVFELAPEVTPVRYRPSGYIHRLRLLHFLTLRIGNGVDKLVRKTLTSEYSNLSLTGNSV